jgi:hypothetical protein
MSEDSTTQCLLFPGIFHKPVVAQFDQREGSSDGGALLLKAADMGAGSCLAVVPRTLNRGSISLVWPPTVCRLCPDRRGSTRPGGPRTVVPCGIIC